MKNYLCDKKDLQDYNHLARMVRRKEKKGHEGQRTAPRGEIGFCRYSLMHQVKDQ